MIVECWTNYQVGWLLFVSFFVGLGVGFLGGWLVTRPDK